LVAYITTGSLLLIIPASSVPILLASLTSSEYVHSDLLSLTAIFNTIYEYFINKNKSRFVQKIVAAILIIIGVILIKI
jgi:hypothetical protein